jgi:hypothetical protein
MDEKNVFPTLRPFSSEQLYLSHFMWFIVVTSHDEVPNRRGGRMP